MDKQQQFDYDFIIIGSGFGGSVSALRLSEKGYRVLVLEKGKWLSDRDFPKTNWHVKKWLWLPLLRFFGLFKLTLFRHIAVLSGVGVGGGSLVYANTLPIPKVTFFKAQPWGNLADWETELKPFYQTALQMMGATPNPRLEVGDRALHKLAQELGKDEQFSPTNVAVYFGEPAVPVGDPYFDGKGPNRAGCIFCGGCMLGCRHNAKNTLVKNYLHFAQQQGAQIRAESEVFDVTPLEGTNGSEGYRVKWRSSTSSFKSTREVSCQGVVFAGGVLGTLMLLLKLRRSSLPRLSDKLGCDIRTNSESLIGVTTFDKQTVFSDGLAIGSLLQTDDHSHLEPVRYSAGSGIWRILMSPMAFGSNVFKRLAVAVWDVIRHPIENVKIYFVSDWSKRTQILLFMQSINTTLKFSKGLFRLKTSVSSGKAPTAFIPEAKPLFERYAKIVNGKPMMLATETVAGIPTTAHILGGAVMGGTRDEGVIDKDNRVFGYEKMYICDGSMISANPGVNPSLTIMALTERAMSKIPAKQFVSRTQKEVERKAA